MKRTGAEKLGYLPEHHMGLYNTYHIDTFLNYKIRNEIARFNSKNSLWRRNEETRKRSLTISTILGLFVALLTESVRGEIEYRSVASYASLHLAFWSDVSHADGHGGFIGTSATTSLNRIHRLGDVEGDLLSPADAATPARLGFHRGLRTFRRDVFVSDVHHSLVAVHSNDIRFLLE